MRPHLLGRNAAIACAERKAEPGPLSPVFAYRRRYRCWACRSEGVLEFEPDALEPSWTECHQCGIDNEIPPGLCHRPAIIPGQVPGRLI